MAANLNHLRTFVLVAQTGSLTQAAERLSVTQGAVSQQITRLEGYLGIKLFERQARGLSLTEPGRRLFRGVATSINRVDAEVQAARIQPHTESICVTSNGSFAAQCLIPCLLDFEERHPNIRLRLETTTRLLDFDVDGVDIAIRQGNAGWAGVDYELLCRDQVIAVTTPEFEAEHELAAHPERLVGLPLLYDLENPTEWQAWLEAAGYDGSNADLSRGFNDTLVMLGALRAGVAGVGLVGRQLVCHELASGELVQVSDVMVEPDYAYYLVYPSRELLTPAATKFRDWLTSWFAVS